MCTQRRLASRLAVVVLLVLVAGCGDEEGPTNLQTSYETELEALLEAPFNRNWPATILRSGYPWPGTPDKAIANVRDAYHDQDLATYAAMISPDFRFVLQTETIEEYVLERGVLDAREEIRIFLNMCRGLPSQDGERITDIEVVQMEPLTAWEPVLASDPHFGTLPDAERRSYQVLMTFDREGHIEPFTVTGEVELVVVHEDFEDYGARRPAYRLVGGYDKTVRADGTDELLWGSLKVSFR